VANNNNVPIALILTRQVAGRVSWRFPACNLRCYALIYSSQRPLIIFEICFLRLSGRSLIFGLLHPAEKFVI